MTTIQKPKTKHYSTLDRWNVFMEMHWSKICADCKDLGLHPHATQKLNDANCTFRNATSLRGNKRGWVISTSTCTVPVALFLSCIYMSCISQNVDTILNYRKNPPALNLNLPDLTWTSSWRVPKLHNFFLAPLISNSHRQHLRGKPLRELDWSSTQAELDRSDQFNRFRISGPAFRRGRRVCR